MRYFTKLMQNKLGLGKSFRGRRGGTKTALSVSWSVIELSTYSRRADPILQKVSSSPLAWLDSTGGAAATTTTTIKPSSSVMTPCVCSALGLDVRALALSCVVATWAELRDDLDSCLGGYGTWLSGKPDPRVLPVSTDRVRLVQNSVFSIVQPANGFFSQKAHFYTDRWDSTGVVD